VLPLDQDGTIWERQERVSGIDDIIEITLSLDSGVLCQVVAKQSIDLGKRYTEPLVGLIITLLGAYLPLAYRRRICLAETEDILKDEVWVALVEVGITRAKVRLRRGKPVRISDVAVYV
jgi:hypothetical protein